MATTAPATSLAPTSVLDPSRQDESRSHQLTTAVILCPIFAGVFTALRVYTRIVLIKVHFWEDLTLVTAWACALAMSVFMQLGVLYGNGRHVETITPPELVESVRVGIAVTQFYSLTHYFIKLSILLQYVRISVMPSDKRLCYFLLALLNAGYLVFLIMRMARCVPFQAQWTPGIPGARCFFGSSSLMFSSQIWNMAMDFVILLAPLYILRHFTGSFLHRVLIGLVLAFGASSCIVSVLRLQTLYQAAVSADPSWDMIPCAIYALIEVNVGISCASLATLRPLIRQLRKILPPENRTKEASRLKGVASEGGLRRNYLVSSTVLATRDLDVTRLSSEGHGVELESGATSGSGRPHISILTIKATGTNIDDPGSGSLAPK